MMITLCKGQLSKELIIASHNVNGSNTSNNSNVPAFLLLTVRKILKLTQDVYHGLWNIAWRWEEPNMWPFHTKASCSIWSVTVFVEFR